MPLRPLRASPLGFSLILLFAVPVTALAQWEMDLGTHDEFPIVKFQAQAGRVGTPGWRSDVNIRQAFDASALRELELDNAGANVTIQAIMVDEDGMELVSIGGANPAEVPLSRSRGGKPWKGTFKREGRDPHGLRVEVEQRSGQIRTVIRFARSLVDVPTGCLGGEERVLLTTSLTVDDGTDAPSVQFVATQPWRCKARRSGGWTLRGQNARGDAEHDAHNADGENRRPNAKLTTNNATRENGVRNFIEADASRSKDRDGTIVSYLFRVLDRKTEAPLHQVGPQASPKTGFWLHPGDYLISVTVVDDDGSSHSDTRNTSVRD